MRSESKEVQRVRREGGGGCEVQKPLLWCPCRGGGGGGGEERKWGDREKRTGRRDRRGVGTQIRPLMESKHQSVLTLHDFITNRQRELRKQVLKE